MKLTKLVRENGENGSIIYPFFFGKTIASMEGKSLSK
jgi:hypothetical protein